MPLARIRTADPVSAADLAAELHEAGFEFEFALPDEQCAQEADVEIRAEHLPVQQAFDRAYEMNNEGASVYVAPGLLEPAEAARPVSSSPYEPDIRIEHTPRDSKDFELPDAIPYAQSIDLDPQHGAPRFDYERSDRRSRLAEGIAGMRGMVEGTISNFRERQAERATRRNAESAARAEQTALLRKKQLEDLAEQREEARKRREEYERQQDQDRLAQEQRERELTVQRERALALQRERDAEEARKALELQRQREEEQRQQEEARRQREAVETQIHIGEEKRRAEEQRRQEIADAPRLEREAKLRQEYERTLAEERKRREQQFAEERERELQARREEERRDLERQEQLRREEQIKRAAEAKREEERRQREARELVARREREAATAEVVPIAAAVTEPAEDVRESENKQPAQEPVVAMARAEERGNVPEDIHEVPATSSTRMAAVPLMHTAERPGDTSPAGSLFGERPRQRAFQFAAVAAAVIAVFVMSIWAIVAGRRPADPLNFGRNGQPNIQQAVPFGAATIAPRAVQAATPPRVAAPAKSATTTRPQAKAPAQTAAKKPSARKRAAVATKKKTTTTRTARRRNGVRQYSDLN